MGLEGLICSTGVLQPVIDLCKSHFVDKAENDNGIQAVFTRENKGSWFYAARAVLGDQEQILALCKEYNEKGLCQKKQP